MNHSLLQVQRLTKHFPVEGGWLRPPRHVHAVDDISFSLSAGESFALVGESGCGKTTTARLLAKLEKPDEGSILFDEQEVAELSGPALKQYNRDVQMIFQDPFESLNPRRTVRAILRQPLLNHDAADKGEIDETVVDLLNQVGMEPGEIFMDRYPHQLSGGQRQRIGIARALTLKPRLVIADEPVSSLDISIRAQILNLLKTLQAQHDLSYLFITHDLGVVRSVCDRVGVMYLGEIVELAAVESLFTTPLHPYTQALLSATPVADPVKARERRRIILKGEVPSALDPPAGCRFHTRCPYSEKRCVEEKPSLRELRPGHTVACHFAGDVGVEAAAGSST
ncbi:MAG: ATP-binding cassette domain-containing protein [Nitrospinae bacterium]|nr:ATP-binding cassette domain-containing protein [Nitrospinota bacterium]